MLRESGFKPQTKTVNMVLMNGGVGDHVATLTVIDYINKKYLWITQIVWMPDFLVEFSKHLLPGTQIYGYSEMKGKYQPHKASKTTKWDGMTSPMKIHLVDYAFLKLTDELPGIEHKNYLQIKPELINNPHNLPPNYVVITTGYTAKVRQFKPEAINKITDWLLTQGVTPVFLGQTQTKTGAAHIIKGQFEKDIDFSKGINLIDKTDLLQAAKIMHESKAVLGVDNGLMHVAGCTKAPIIGGFTTVTPEIRWPIRYSELGYDCYEVLPEPTLACRFCQEKTNFLFGHDYTKCVYNDYKCTDQITAEKFIKALEGLGLKYE